MQLLSCFKLERKEAGEKSPSEILMRWSALPFLASISVVEIGMTDCSLSTPRELHRYIDLPERLGCPASGRDRAYPFGIDCIRCLKYLCLVLMATDVAIGEE